MSEPAKRRLPNETYIREVLMRQPRQIVPQREPSFTLNIELNCKDCSEAEVAVLEHIAYKMCHDAVKKGLADIIRMRQARNVPQTVIPHVRD